MDKDFILSVRNGTGRAGKTNLLKYLNGKRLTRSQSIYAKCYDCNGMGESDKCEIEECPLLPYSSYRVKGVKSPRGPQEAIVEQGKVSKKEVGV